MRLEVLAIIIHGLVFLIHKPQRMGKLITGHENRRNRALADNHLPKVLVTQNKNAHVCRPRVPMGMGAHLERERV